MTLWGRGIRRHGQEYLPDGSTAEGDLTTYVITASASRWGMDAGLTRAPAGTGGR